VYLSINQNVKGYFTIRNNYREGLAEVISNLSQTYDLHLLTGDNESEKINLKQWFPDETKIHFNQSPTDKLNYIRQLNAQNKRVLMIGDGLNDAGALLESHAGIAIADSVYNFSPACDAILEARQFAQLPQFLNFTKRTMQIVKISFAISLLYNAIGLSFAVRGLLAPIIAAILMPASSVTVVAFVTLATTLLAERKLK